MYNLLLFHVDTQFFQIHFGDYPFPIEWSWHPHQRLFHHIHEDLFLDSIFCFIYLYACLYVSNTFDCCGFVICFKIQGSVGLQLVLFKLLCCLGSLEIPRGADSIFSTKIDKWDIRLSNFMEENNEFEKATFRMGETFANHICEKELITIILNEASRFLFWKFAMGILITIALRSVDCFGYYGILTTLSLIILEHGCLSIYLCLLKFFHLWFCSFSI